MTRYLQCKWKLIEFFIFCHMPGKRGPCRVPCKCLEHTSTHKPSPSTYQLWTKPYSKSNRVIPWFWFCLPSPQMFCCYGLGGYYQIPCPTPAERPHQRWQHLQGELCLFPFCFQSSYNHSFLWWYVIREKFCWGIETQNALLFVHFPHENTDKIPGILLVCPPLLHYIVLWRANGSSVISPSASNESSIFKEQMLPAKGLNHPPNSTACELCAQIANTVNINIAHVSLY